MVTTKVPTQQQIPLSKLVAHPDNPRGTEFEREQLELLAGSLSRRQVQRVIVRPRGDRFEIIAGARRVAAARLAGLETIACEIVYLDGPAAAQVMVDENLLRQDLSPLGVARAIKLLCTPAERGGGGLSQSEAARRYGHDESWANNLIRVLRLPEPWLDLVAARVLPLTCARLLVPYRDNQQVLAAVWEDLHTNPERWARRKVFEESLKIIVDGFAALEQARVSQETRPTPARATPRVSQETRPVVAPRAATKPAAGDRRRVDPRPAVDVDRLLQPFASSRAALQAIHDRSGALLAALDD